MSGKLKFLTVISLFFVFVSIVGTIVVVYSQKQENQNNKSEANQQVDENVPIADYNSVLPQDSAAKSKREKRNKSRNIKLKNPEDVKKFMITERRETGYGGFESHSPKEPAIPARTSSVIVIGEVTDATAYLTEDKISVYSEFNINVGEVLKNSSGNAINSGSSISTSRVGGAVRFESGKVIKKLFDGKPMPSKKHKYLFFLEYNADTEDYPLITAYELRNGQVFPLDGIERSGLVPEQLAAHQTYKEMPEIDFLKLVKRAINDSKDVFEKESI